MKHWKLAVLVGVFALVALPAMAIAGKPSDPGSQGKGHVTQGSHGTDYAPEPPAQPGPKATLPEKAKAYGVYCKAESRKHVKGEKGTPFSRCVTAMAKAAKHERMNAKKACKGLSKKHVKGEKGTPFSRCVVAAAKLKKQQDQEETVQA